MRNTILGLVACISTILPTSVCAGSAAQDTIKTAPTVKKSWASRLSVGGYGEAVMTRNFYSDSYLRYISPEN
jgi:hypothetical protein